MQRHTRIYMIFFDYGEQDYVPCEMCGQRCKDVHHIDRRGMGGSDEKDYIENLAGLCREHHDKAEAEPEYNEMVKFKHMKKVMANLKSGYKNLKKHNLEKWVLTEI